MSTIIVYRDRVITRNCFVYPSPTRLYKIASRPPRERTVPYTMAPPTRGCHQTLYTQNSDNIIINSVMDYLQNSGLIVLSSKFHVPGPQSLITWHAHILIFLNDGVQHTKLEGNQVTKSICVIGMNPGI